MGSSQCCSCQNEEKQSEVLIKVEDTEKSSRRSSKHSPQQNFHQLRLKQKVKNKSEEAATPGFAELKSVGSKRSEHSQKDIELVAEIVMEMEDVEEKNVELQQSPLQSQKSVKKRKNDSPICEFQAKNSLKSFDISRLEKLKSLKEQKNNQQSDGELDSQRSLSADNKSVKSILKQELKYSQFRKFQTQNDNESKKQVKFQK